jgi:hypothetical protein
MIRRTGSSLKCVNYSSRSAGVETKIETKITCYYLSHCQQLQAKKECGIDKVMTPQGELEERLCQIARSSAWFMAALAAVRDLQLPSWCIGAGAVRKSK